MRQMIQTSASQPRKIRAAFAPRPVATGGILLAGAGRGGVHENRKRPSPRKDRKRWNAGRNSGGWD